MDITQRIKPKHLKLMLKIADTRQLQLAAQTVSMSQPAASRILSDLEATFRTKLFVRHPSGMEPTAAGHLLLRHARVVLSELNTLGQEMDRLAMGAAGNVRVGAVTGPAVGYLMPAIQAVTQAHPNLRVSVEVAPSSQLLQGLERVEYDFILARSLPQFRSGDYIFHPAKSETIRLLVHASHPLADLKKVSLRSLSQFPWIIQSEGNPIRDAVETAFRLHKAEAPDRVLDSSSLLVVLARLAQNDGIAPQTEEVANLLLSEEIRAKLSVLALREKIELDPYFLIQSKTRSLSRAAELVRNHVIKNL